MEISDRLKALKLAADLAREALASLCETGFAQPSPPPSHREK